MITQPLSIIIVIIATIINSIVFGYVASNAKNNKINKSYLIFLSFIVLYTIFDCIVIQMYSAIEAKDIIVKIQALFWMPLSILFMHFIYSLLLKKKDKIFFCLSTLTIVSILITLFSNKVLIGFKDYNFGTMAYTGPWFLPTTFLGILPAAIYALYLISKEGNVLSYNDSKTNKEDIPLATQQLKILFFGSMICLVIAVTTNIFFDEVLGYNGELHLASLSLSIQSIFLLPAIIKYNFLKQPIEKLGDELYALSSDAVLIINNRGIILNINQAARKLFNLQGKIKNKNIQTLFHSKYNYLNKTLNSTTITGKHVTVVQNDIKISKKPFGKILVIRDITELKISEKKLLDITKELKTAQEVAGLGSFVYNIKKDIVMWSDKLFQIYGRDPKIFIPTRDTFFNEIVHPESREKSKQIVDDALKNKVENFDYVHKTLMPNGEEKWFQAIININYNAKGKPIIMNGTSQDITEIYSSRHLLEESKLRLKMAIEIAQLGRWEENHKTGEIYWSSILRKMFHLDMKRKIKNNDFWKSVHEDDIEWMKKNWSKAEKDKKPYSGTFRIQQKSGEIRHFIEHAEFILNSKGNLEKTVGTVIDMTELHKYQEELRKLSSHIQEVQEEERGRIAREIHDALGQRLTIITMDLEFLKNKLGNETPNEITDRLCELAKITDETIQLTRKISQELHPSILDDLGLISAIEWLKEQYNKRTDIHFTLNMPKEEVNINGEHATAIFRITQESLTNIMRHAEAQNVIIEIIIINSEIILTIKDDGKGIIEKENINNRETFGIFSMKERASNLGGKLTISNNIKKGTTVDLTLPYNYNQEIIS